MTEARVTGDDLRELRERHFGESRRVFEARSGVPARSMARYELGQSEIPLWLGFVISARLHRLRPWGFLAEPDE